MYILYNKIMNIKNKLWNRVRELRKEQWLKQQELADKTGLHRTYISDIERGVKNVSVENIEKIAIAMSLDIKELF
jgi:transcriptional regulator with XRE-family HTH domain